MHGPYPSGNASAQPDLKFAFPDPAQGAVDQSFRLIVKPDLVGRSRPHPAGEHVRHADHYVRRGLHRRRRRPAATSSKARTAACCSAGCRSLNISPGGSSYSDAVDLKLPSGAITEGRKLAVSFHVTGPTGPMTWHAKALQTSYLSRPRSGAHTSEEDDAAFPFTTTSWYFLDAVDVMAPANTVVVCAFGDSITDGTLSTLNGDDRWPDVLSRRLHAAYGNRVSVVNAGIGGNRILTPDTLPAAAAVLRRTVGAAAARTGCFRPVRPLGGRASRRDQRHQLGRIGRRHHRRHEGARVARQGEEASRLSARPLRRR